VKNSLLFIDDQADDEKGIDAGLKRLVCFASYEAVSVVRAPAL
jgi:hypothetical protein